MGTLPHAEVARVVNDRIVGIVQIESRGAVEAADEIAALDEVDAARHITVRTDRPVAEVAEDVEALLDTRLAAGVVGG